MATAYVTIGATVRPGIIDGESSRSAAHSTSGTSSTTSITAGREEVALIYCASAVYARSGGTAAASNSVYCPPGVVTAIGMTEGDGVSLIDV